MSDIPPLSTAIGRLCTVDYADPDATYFVTLCVQDRHPVFANPVFAQPVIDCLHWLRTNRGLAVYTYCVMPDHLHLLIRPGGNLGSVIKSLKRQTTRDSTRVGRGGKLWQDNYYDHVLRKTEDAQQIALYILANPVRKGLVSELEEYAWSGSLDPI